MKICKENKENTDFEFIPGNLYRKPAFNTEDVWICTGNIRGHKRLVRLKDGMAWTSSTPPAHPLGWTDVTNQYCLKRVNNE